MSAKWVRELHGLYYQVFHSKGWKSCTFSFLSYFVAKTQNPFVYNSCFDQFTVPLLADFVVDGDRDEILFCPIRAVKRYFSRTEELGPEYCLFVSMNKRKNQMSRSTNWIWIRS